MLPSQNPCSFRDILAATCRPVHILSASCPDALVVHRGQSANLNDTACPYTCQGFLAASSSLETASWCTANLGSLPVVKNCWDSAEKRNLIHVRYIP